MTNNFFDKVKSRLVVKITGKNIERFIKRLITNGIEILNMKHINYKEIIITIYERDYEKLNNIKTIYNTEILDTKGLIKIKSKFILNLPLFLSFIICFIVLIFLFNMIFSVKIIHNNSEIRELLTKELNYYGIKKYSFKKDYNYIKKVKEEILNKYKDKIEWLEIERLGVNYYVRVELREILDKDVILPKRHVIAKKDAIIKSINANIGVVEKEINSYVKKGDIIINGYIKLNEEIKDIVSAEGTIYGETWYKVSVEYPTVYKEMKKTGNSKKLFVIKFFNKRFDLFNFKPFKKYKSRDKIIFDNNIIPISLVQEYQEEIIEKEQIYTEEESISGGLNLAREKILSQLSEKEYIISEKVLNVYDNFSKIEVEVFFTVYEDITDYLEIVEE